MSQAESDAGTGEDALLPTKRVTLIQSYVRMHQARQRYLKLKGPAMKRRRYLQMIKSAKKIQSWCRAILARKKFRAFMQEKATSMTRLKNARARQERMKQADSDQSLSYE